MLNRKKIKYGGFYGPDRDSLRLHIFQSISNYTEFLGPTF